MNLYAHDLSLFDFANFSDNPIIAGQSSSSLISTYEDLSDSDYATQERNFDDSGKDLMKNHRSLPKHRHDGTSPLPLGMDWSTPPRKWDGRDTVWPHDPHTGWSYCVTVPSWLLLPKSGGSDRSDPVAFYRVQVGIQSPEGVTTIRGILRRFSDFLKLWSELKKTFPRKNLPPAPPKRILSRKSRTKSTEALEERRCSLEDWMEKLLSDIDISRSAAVAMFLELEAAVRSSFEEVEQQDTESSFSGVVPPFLSHSNSDASIIAGGSTIISELDNNDSTEEISELGTERNFITENIERFSRRQIRSGRQSIYAGRDKQRQGSVYGTDQLSELEYGNVGGHFRRLSTESFESDVSSVQASEISNSGVASILGDGFRDHLENSGAHKSLGPYNSDIQFQKDFLVVLLSDERHKLKRVLNTMQRRLATFKTDMEDLIARLNQEVAVKQFLATKVKDLEVELETTRENCKENLEQAILSEKERFTQMQWDMEELRKQCLEMELKLKAEQDEKARLESARLSTIQENEMLLQELDAAREQFENLHKHHEELEVKSKAEVKLLVKEVKSLRNSQSELKQELGRVMKENLELERVLLKEKQRMQLSDSANEKLLHECEILRNRLQECSVNFLTEEEDKLILDTSSPSDAIDLLTTSDNRIGLLLAEAQLLAQDVVNSVAGYDEGPDNELRKMLTDVFVDNATLRKQVNSVMRCALNPYVKSDKEEDDDDEDEDEEGDEFSLRKTVLSKFLER